MRILHGCCYKDSLAKSYYSSVIFMQYTPKMYEDLFNAALQEKMTQIKFQLIEPWRKAVSFLQKDDAYTDKELALEFILWILFPLGIKIQDALRQGFR